MPKKGYVYKNGEKIYPVTVSQEVYDNETGNTVKQDLTEIGAKCDKFEREVVDNESANQDFADGDGHVVLRLNSSGVNARVYNICNSSGQILGSLSSSTITLLQNLSTLLNGIESTPSANSTNLVTSGGVKAAIDELNTALTAMVSGLVNNDHSSNQDFADGSGNVVLRLNSDGVNAKVYNICDSGGNIVGSINASVLASLLSLQTFTVNDGRKGFKFADGSGNVVFEITKDGLIDAIGFGSHLANLAGSTPKIINCVGDSITQGQMGLVEPVTSLEDCEFENHNYPNELQSLLGDTYTVRNYGYGGNKPSDIISTMGFSEIVVNQDFILYADGTASTINDSEYLRDSFANRTIVNLLTQYRTTYGTYAVDAQTYCYVLGIKCLLTRDSTTGVFSIARVEQGTEDIHISSGSTILMSGALEKNAIYTFFVGQNDILQYVGDDFVAYMRKVTDSVPSGRFLVLGIPYIAAERAEAVRTTNAALQAEFGGRFIDLQRFFNTQQSFDLMGITPTTDADIPSEMSDLGVLSDETLMAAYRTPSSWWRFVGKNNVGGEEVDGVHLNGLAYIAIAKLLYGKIKEFDW